MITLYWNGSSYSISSDLSYAAPAGADRSPLDILCESLGMCIAVSLVRLMERDKLECDSLTVEVEPFKAAVGPSRVERFQVNVEFPHYLSQVYKEKLLTQASRACTIGNTLKQGAEINYDIKD